MGAQKGRLLLVEVEDEPGSGNFIELGGLRTKSLKINNEAVDVTTDDSEGYRELLEGRAGINSIDASGAGLITDKEGFDIAREAAETDEHLNYRVTIPGDTYSRVYTGKFKTSECEMTGEHKDAAAFKLTLLSAEKLTITRLGA